MVSKHVRRLNLANTQVTIQVLFLSRVLGILVPLSTLLQGLTVMARRAVALEYLNLRGVSSRAPYVSLASMLILAAI